jgi:transposase-like protein
MKRSHKLRGMGDVAEIVAFAPDRTSAAAQLGVNRSTLHRWIKAGKVPEPGSARPKVGTAVPAASGEAGASPSPDLWFAAASGAREFTPTERQLLELARAALRLAYDSADDKTRLSAMSRFQGLVKQVNLGASSAAADKPSSERADRPRRPYLTSMDPRKMIMAVK